MCSQLVVFGPLILYGAIGLWHGFIVATNIEARTPGFSWQFRRASYTEDGWRAFKICLWMFLGFIPFGITLVYLARLFCKDATL